MRDDKHDEDALPEDDSAGGRELELLAMRTVVGVLPVHEMCSNRACQRTGLCHMVIGPDGTPQCGVRFNADLMAYACHAIVHFIAHQARVFGAGQPWSRYDRDLGQSARQSKRPGSRGGGASLGEPS